MEINKNRIEVVDSLRGFALMGIMLLHSIEHFNFYVFPQPDTLAPWVRALDTQVWNSLFFMFGGKAYAIFSLLFGFTFSLMLAKQQRRGGDFSCRFLWRMLLLAGFALINGAFFPGEVLLMYALLGTSLIFVRHLKAQWLLFAAVLFLLQPFEWGRYVLSLCDGDYTFPLRQSGPYWRLLKEGQMGDSFVQLVKNNTLYGHKVSLMWAWEMGRVSQTVGLFFLGFWLGKTAKFMPSVSNASFWKRLLIASVIVFIPFYVLHGHLNSMIEDKGLLRNMRSIVEMYRNLAFTLFLVAAFILLYSNAFFQRLVRGLRYPGRMSLTAYIFQSIIGGFVFYGYGLGIGPHTNHTLALGVGILLFLLQFYFCKFWILKFQQGPLEKWWHQLTWINFSKKEK